MDRKIERFLDWNSCSKLCSKSDILWKRTRKWDSLSGPSSPLVPCSEEIHTSIIERIHGREFVLQRIIPHDVIGSLSFRCIPSFSAIRFHLFPGNNFSLIFAIFLRFYFCKRIDSLIVDFLGFIKFVEKSRIISLFFFLRKEFYTFKLF